jgi:hypothetical protein
MTGPIGFLADILSVRGLCHHGRRDFFAAKVAAGLKEPSNPERE